MSQEQQDQEQIQVQDAAAEEEEEGRAASLPASSNASTAASTSASEQTEDEPRVLKKRVKRKGKLVNVDEVLPRPSFWPVVLALALALFCFGFIWNKYVLFLGLALFVVAAIGWVLERR